MLSKLKDLWAGAAPTQMTADQSAAVAQYTAQQQAMYNAQNSSSSPYLGQAQAALQNQSGVQWSNTAGATIHNNPNLGTGTYVSGSGAATFPGTLQAGSILPGNYQGVYITGSTTSYASWKDPEVDELKKTVGQLIKRIEWLEAQPILKDNPPPIGLIEKEET